MQRGMRPFPVVVFQPFSCHLIGFVQIPWLSMQEKRMLVRSPESFHDDVIGPATFPVHADLYPLCPYDFLPFRRCILTALVGIENNGAPTTTQGHFQSLEA